MTENLLPCPFCNGEAEIVGGPENWAPTFYDPDSGGDPIAVVCKTCACGLHFFDGYAEAASAWNRRAQPENKPLTCEGCESQGEYENEVEYGYPSPCTDCARRSIDNYHLKPEEVAP
jgi:hypothetical protein